MTLRIAPDVEAAELVKAAAGVAGYGALQASGSQGVCLSVCLYTDYYDDMYLCGWVGGYYSVCGVIFVCVCV